MGDAYTSLWSMSIEKGENHFLSCVVPYHVWCVAHELYPLGLVCEAGGKVHLQANIDPGPRVNKYHEGKVKQDSVKRGNSV